MISCSSKFFWHALIPVIFTLGAQNGNGKKKKKHSHLRTTLYLKLPERQTQFKDASSISYHLKIIAIYSPSKSHWKWSWKLNSSMSINKSHRNKNKTIEFQDFKSGHYWHKHWDLPKAGEGYSWTRWEEQDFEHGPNWFNPAASAEPHFAGQ